MAVQRSTLRLDELWRDLDTPDLVLISPAVETHRHWLLRALLWTGGAIAALVVSAAGYAYWQARSIVGEMQAGEKLVVVQSARKELGVEPRRSIDSARMSGYFITGADRAALREEGAQTILLIGSDRRWGESGRGRSDTMLLLRILPKASAISILSIPRDLRVPIPGYGYDKVNAAYSYGGARLLIATLREYFGVRIDHFIEINFRGFGDMVTALGGVYIPVDQRYYVPPNSGYMAIDLQPGYQVLRRNEALSFVRFRHFDSDFYRAARQQLFLREAGRQVMNARYDFRKMQSLLRSFAKATTSDISSLGELWQMADTMRSTPAENIQRLTVPGVSSMLDGVSYVVQEDSARTRTIAQWYHPEWTIKKQKGVAQSLRPVRKRRVAEVAASSLLRDSTARLLFSASSSQGLAICAPGLRPSGYYWPSRASRSYTLNGYRAFAAFETVESGRSLLWMFTDWQDPPILSEPSDRIRSRGRTYDLYFENGQLRQVAWRIGSTRAWITNTLKNELSAEEMISLANSCQRVS